MVLACCCSNAGRFPRHKVCGEFVSAESLELLSDLLAPQDTGLVADAVRIARARLFLDGRMIETPVDPPAASISRLDLDAALWDSAEKAELTAGSKLSCKVFPGHGPFLVTTSVGEFESRALINASGRWSNLNPTGPT